jgi:hypothetical protein
MTIGFDPAELCLLLYLIATSYWARPSICAIHPQTDLHVYRTNTICSDGDQEIHPSQHCGLTDGISRSVTSVRLRRDLSSFPPDFAIDLLSMQQDYACCPGPSALLAATPFPIVPSSLLTHFRSYSGFTIALHRSQNCRVAFSSRKSHPRRCRKVNVNCETALSSHLTPFNRSAARSNQTHSQNACIPLPAPSPGTR